jgi:hypothetical protein
MMTLASCGSNDPAFNLAFIDWASLRNPVLQMEDRSLKDMAVAYNPATDEFYIFSSTRFEVDDPGRETKERYFFITKDWQSYETFTDAHLNGPGYGPGSPDLTFIDGLWYMTYQLGTFVGGDARVLWYSTSSSLRDWSAARELAPELLDPALRNIDGALAKEGDYFYLGWKRIQQFFVTRSLNPTVDGQWLPAQQASAAGAFAENFQFIKIDGEWRMIATGQEPGPYRCPQNPQFLFYTCNHEPFIYRMEQGNGDQLEDWTSWVDKRHLTVPYEDWNTIMHANSGYLVDWREYDGYFYLFYAGSDDGDRFELRGHGKIGVARSRDLIHWRAAGEPEA